MPENHTDKIQTIDAGFGKMLKKRIGEEMDKWLEEDNLELWHNKITARQRRILMTKGTGAACRVLLKEKEFIKRIFQKTGCLITIDGNDDNMTNPQGLEDYSQVQNKRGGAFIFFVIFGDPSQLILAPPFINLSNFSRGYTEVHKHIIDS